MCWTSHSPPRSPLSTRLSGSARETELRIRSIFQWKKKRPPVLLMALVGAAILLCGSLVSCQGREAEEEPPAPAVEEPPAPNVEEPPARTVEELAQRLELESLQVWPDGRFEAWLHDGNYEWAQSVRINGTAEDGPTEVHWEG